MRKTRGTYWNKKKEFSTFALDRPKNIINNSPKRLLTLWNGLVGVLIQKSEPTDRLKLTSNLLYFKSENSNSRLSSQG